MIKSWLNGSPSNSISITDRGLLYGDGFFTTIAVLDAKPLLWRQHLARIQESTKRLSLALDFLQLEKSFQKFLNECPLQGRFIVKVLVTRAESGRGYSWGDNQHTNIIFQLFEYNEYEKLIQLRQTGLTTNICKTPLAKNKLLAGLKHLNRLEQVLATNEFDKNTVDEGIMLDVDGWIIEGCKSNIFILTDNKLLTPKLEFSGVEGVMRQYILENFKSNTFQLEEASFKVEQLKQADAIFMSNSIWGLCPVKNIVGSDWQANNKLVSQIKSSILLHEACF